ncbi:MAG: hypothetical protein AABX17_00885 [Nanoarchaeota archaeon]
MPRSKYLAELNNYLEKVSTGELPLELGCLLKRIAQAHAHRVPSRDICELFEKYGSVPSETKRALIAYSTRVPVPDVRDRVLVDVSQTRVPGLSES